MHDYQARLEKLRTDAAECRLICDLATDPAKQEMFDRLALHLTTLADQVEKAMLHSKPYGDEVRPGGPRSSGNPI
jgi:hypothetical protein